MGKCIDRKFSSFRSNNSSFSVNSNSPELSFKLDDNDEKMDKVTKIAIELSKKDLEYEQTLLKKDEDEMKLAIHLSKYDQEYQQTLLKKDEEELKLAMHLSRQDED